MTTTYAPIKEADFNSKGLNFNGNGVAMTVTANTTTNIDFKVTSDNIINGLTLLVKAANTGDYATFQVVDVDNILGYGAGTVLNQFGTNWYIDASVQMQSIPRIPYPAKIIAGLYLRLVYTSTAVTAPWVAANYHLHKVMY